MKTDLDPINIYAYAWLMLRDELNVPIIPAPHHEQWMQLVCQEKYKKLLIIAPPGSAKTTWIISAFVGLYVGKYPERSVIIASVSDDVAEKRSLMIRSTTETDGWKSMFPNVHKNEMAKWEQKEWSIGTKNEPRTHPTVRSYGVGSSIIGSRADLLVADDILDFDNTRTKHQRELVKEWFYNSFLSRLTPSGRVIVIGTSWNADDLYANIRQNPEGWVISHVPQLSPADDGTYMDITYAN